MHRRLIKLSRTAMKVTLAVSVPISGGTYAARTSVGSLGLKKGNAFGYWFDFGDDWWHYINVTDIKRKAGSGKYPKVTKRVGKSPPQYVDWDEEDAE